MVHVWSRLEPNYYVLSHTEALKWSGRFFRRSCLSSLLTYISLLWRLSGISEICRFIGWFHKHWKWRVGNRENPVFDWMNLIRTKFCFVRRLNLYWNNKQLRVKQNILWIKGITSPDVNRFRVKIMTYYLIIIRLSSLRLDSGVYTLRVMRYVCAVKFARRLDVTLEFNWI